MLLLQPGLAFGRSFAEPLVGVAVLSSQPSCNGVCWALLLLQCWDLPPAPVQPKAGTGVYWNGAHGCLVQVVTKGFLPWVWGQCRACGSTTGAHLGNAVGMYPGKGSVSLRTTVHRVTRRLVLVIKKLPSWPPSKLVFARNLSNLQEQWSCSTRLRAGEGMFQSCQGVTDYPSSCLPP